VAGWRVETSIRDPPSAPLAWEALQERIVSSASGPEHSLRAIAHSVAASGHSMSARLRPTERNPADGSEDGNRQGFANWIISSTARAVDHRRGKKIPSMTVVRKLILAATDNICRGASRVRTLEPVGLRHAIDFSLQI
jgi:hypothetical protein